MAEEREMDRQRPAARASARVGRRLGLHVTRGYLGRHGAREAEPMRDLVAGPCQTGRPRRSNTVWHRKASRLRLSIIAARYCWPGPKLCSTWSPLVLSTLWFSFAIFHRPRPACAASATLSAVIW